jgi:hypothetical protein
VGVIQFPVVCIDQFTDCFTFMMDVLVIVKWSAVCLFVLC